MTETSVTSESISLSAEVRQENLQKLQDQQFDILVIGGGITGAGIVRDAALRGYRTALIEKDDFAAGTSSKSAKLVHGGFRYLKSLEFGLVHEALMERKTLLDIAPHLVRPIQCLLPIYKTDADPSWMIHLGLFLYDWLSFTKSIGRHQMISKKEIEEIEPLLRKEGLQQIAQYYDCQADDFWLVMANLQSAAQNQAIIANYVKAVDILKEDGKVVGIQAYDSITDTSISIRSRVVACAAGPWSDQLRQNLLKDTQQGLRQTKGIHLIIHRDNLPINYPVVGPAVQDRRPIFAIPWKKFVVLGTTETDYDGDPDRILTERSDVDYLLVAFNHFFPNAKLNYDHIVSTFAGLRPLIFETGKDASSVTREYQILEDHQNFFMITGGKLTTYRTMAKAMIDRLSKHLKSSFGISPTNPDCVTDKLPLYGGDIPDYPQFFDDWTKTLTHKYNFDLEIAEHFIETYGSRIPDLLQAIQETADGQERMLPNLPYVWGELKYALKYEITMTLSDFLIRRTHLFSLDPKQALDIHESVANRMGKYLGWSKAEKQAQIETYKSKIKIIQYFREEQ